MEQDDEIGIEAAIPAPFSYTLVDGDGLVVGTGVTLDMPPIAAGLRVIRDVQAAPDQYLDAEEEWRTLPARPSAAHALDRSTKVWALLPLEQLKAAAWRRIKVARAAALAAGVEVDELGRFDADPAAVLNITGVMAGLAYLPADWTIGWTRFDNTAVTLTKATFPQMALAVLAHGDAVHQTARTLREQIESAPDADALALICWPA